MIETEKLRTFLDQLVKDTSLKMRPDGTTFCNIGIGKVAALFEYAGFSVMVNGKFEPMVAREMIATIHGLDGGWLICDGRQASDYSLRGGFAISYMSMAGEHDHVATVYPAKMELSGSLAKEVPMVANIGKKNAVMKSSGAFPVANGEASYAILVD